MKNISVCPICEEGNLEAKVGTNEVEYKGQHSTISMHFSECDCCGSEQASSAELRTNKRLMNEFKKQVDGLLTGTELKGIRLALGLTQADAAKIFGGGPVAFSKYEADDVAQSEAMDKLLRVAQAVPEAYAHLTHNTASMVDVEHLAPSNQWNWEKLVQDSTVTKTSKPRPSLRVISSRDIGQGQDYGQFQAVG